MYLIMIGQLLLSLSILVVLHEMGHFFPARWFNTRVEKFYLFFDPWFSLFKIKRGDTEYGIGWLPLGGYVKISGMVDESMDLEQLKQPAQPWEFRSKPAWQRLIIMLGGVTVNFILGFLLYAMVIWVWGEEYLPASEVKYGITVDSVGMELGLREGDKVLEIGGKPFEKFNDRLVLREIVINNASSMKVERDGAVVTLPIDAKYSSIFSSAKFKDTPLFLPRMPFEIGKLAPNMPAEKSGLLTKDRIIAVNDVATPYFSDFGKQAKSHKNEAISVTALRNNVDTVRFEMTTTEQGTVGIVPLGPDHFFQTKRQEYSVAQAIPMGFTKGWRFLGDQVKAFGQMFKGRIKASESLGGFASIGKMFGYEWDWERFWTMTAVLSLILGFMNLLPIPALDGGHVVFLLYEVASGRKPSDKVLEYSTQIGFFLLMGLLLYANGLDIIRAVMGK